MRMRWLMLPAVVAGAWLSAAGADEPEPKPVRVTVDNFARAESDTYFARFVRDGVFGKIHHVRELAPISKQTVVRLNRDTLYSYGVFDLAAAPLTVTLPNAGKRYLSLQVINQDHYTTDVIDKPGAHVFTKAQVGTRYVCLSIRTFVNSNDDADLKAVRDLQDAIKFNQKQAGKFEVPIWDHDSQKKIRGALLALVAANGGLDSARMFGRKDQVDPVQHLIGTAAAWGGLPRTAATYVGVEPKCNDGKTAYTLTLKDVPVDGFWSVSVYNKDGFFEKNAKNVYTLNTVTAKPSADGSVTIHFGGDQNAPNYLSIMPGWNYTVRLYRPRKEILDSAWKLPEAQPVK